MAEVIAGSRRFQVGTIEQFSNSWFTLKFEDGLVEVVGVKKLRLSPEEVAMVRAEAAAGRAGKMLDWFELHDDGTFSGEPPARVVREPEPLADGTDLSTETNYGGDG